MRRLKHRVLFMGYWYPVVLALLLSPLIGLGAALCVCRDFGMRTLIFAAAVCIAAFVLILLAFYWIYNHLRDDERALIDEAKPPCWRALSEKQRMQLADTPDNTLAAGMIAVFFLPGTCFGAWKLHRQTGGTLPALVLIAAVCVLPVGVYLSGKLRQRFWQRARNDAECAVLHVHRCFTRIRRARYGSRYSDHYAVCYLPDGRYVIQIDREQAQTVTVVRFRGRFRILSP